MLRSSTFRLFRPSDRVGENSVDEARTTLWNKLELLFTVLPFPKHRSGVIGFLRSDSPDPIPGYPQFETFALVPLLADIRRIPTLFSSFHNSYDRSMIQRSNWI